MAIFRNQATLRYNGETTNSNVVVGEITQVISAAKHAPIDTYQIGDTLSYVVSLVNGGATPFTNLTVTDDLGAYAFGEQTLYPLNYLDGSAALYVNGVLVPDLTVEQGPPLTVSGISIPAGGNAVLVYQARVTEFADPSESGTVTNTATVNGTGLSAPVLASETVSVESEALLTITKALSPVPVAENGQLTYTFVIENYGTSAAEATDDLVVTDLFDPILSELTVTLNGQTLAEGTGYTYDQATGLFTTLAGQITVPAATVMQDEVSGEYLITPGVATLVVVGTV